MFTEIPKLLDSLDYAAQTAYTECRYDDLAHGLSLALTFARFSVQCPTAIAESNYMQWYSTSQLPTFLPQVNGAFVREAGTRITGPVAANVYRNPLEHKLHWSTSFHGLGPCKASFGLSLAGFAQLPCLDRQVCKAHGLDPNTVGKLASLKPATGIMRYLTLCGAVYRGEKDMRLAQWKEFYELVPAFRESLHRPVINTILAAYEGE